MDTLETGSTVDMIDVHRIMEMIPHRYPFLMIDKVTEVSPGKYARGYKNLTNNEWFFPKHFEGNPNMPGALPVSYTHLTLPTRS